MFLQQQNIIDKRTRLRWRKARPFYNASMPYDMLQPDNYFLTSEPILGGQNYYVRLKEGYKVAFIIFYDREKRMWIRNKWYTRNGADLNYQVDGVAVNIRDTVYGVKRTTFVPTWVPTGVYARVVACRDDVVLDRADRSAAVASGTPIGTGEDPTEVFFLTDTVQMQRGMEGRPEGYTQRMRLARQVTNVYVHNRLAKKTMAGSSSNGSFVGTTDENSMMIGVPYAAVNGQRLGTMNMGTPGMETYLSLWGNRRSLMYTELPQNKESEYGINWILGSNVTSYGYYAYGMVCNAVPSTLFGMPERADEGIWGNIPAGQLGGLFETVYKNTAEIRADGGAKFRPMDVMYVNGQHVYVLTAVYERGGERWFEVMESSSQCQLYLVTAQMIADRHDYDLENRNRTFNYVRPKAAFYERVGHFDYKRVAALADEVRHTAQKYVPNDDICTFAGDKVTFAAGDAIWLNVRQTNGATRATFDTIKIYRKDGESYVEETSMAMSQPAAGHRKTFTADGSNDVVWDIDVTSYFADKEGLYEATAYNSVTGAESAPVRFEVIKVDIVSAYSADGGKMIVRLGEGMEKEGRTAFVRAMNDTYYQLRNSYANYAHYLVPKGTEGYYGLVLVDLGRAFESSYMAALVVKGEYGWAQKYIARTGSRTNYLSDATVTNGAISIGSMGLSTSGVGANWKTLVKPVTEAMKGNTYHILFNDETRGTFHMIVAQYSTTDSSNFGSSTLIKKQVIRGNRTLGSPITGETVMADVKIADNAAAIAVSLPKDFTNGLNYVGTMVTLPNLVKDEDVGYDYYVGWMDYAVTQDDLEDKTAASLLAYAKGYMKAETPIYTKTVKAEEAKGKKQMYYILWKVGCEPQSGTKSGEISDISWDHDNFTGGGTKAWITYGGKMVTIGDTDYHVACWLESCDAGDILTINF